MSCIYYFERGNYMAIRIFVDAGHNPGTINAGANVNGILEADINFEVGRYLADILRMDNRFYTVQAYWKDSFL